MDNQSKQPPGTPGNYLIKTITSNGPKFMFEAYWDGERWCEVLDHEFEVLGVVDWCERSTGGDEGAAGQGDARDLADARAALAEASEKGTLTLDELLEGVTEENRHQESWTPPALSDKQVIALLIDALQRSTERFNNATDQRLALMQELAELKAKYSAIIDSMDRAELAAEKRGYSRGWSDSLADVGGDWRPHFQRWQDERAERQKAMTGMTRLSEEMGLYDTDEVQE